MSKIELENRSIFCERRVGFMEEKERSCGLRGGYWSLRFYRRYFR